MKTIEEHNDLSNMCQFSDKDKFIKAFQATVDGFSNEDIQKKITGKKGTLTIIKTTNSEVFGCYMNNPWPRESNCYIQNLFVFSFINNKKKPYLIKQKNHQLCQYKCDLNLIQIGDLYLFNKSNLIKQSYFQLGNYFENPFLSWNNLDLIKHDLVLLGQDTFQTVEIEIFTRT